MCVRVLSSVETVQGGVPPYGVKETLVVNGKRVLYIINVLVFIEINKTHSTIKQIVDESRNGH